MRQIEGNALQPSPARLNAAIEGATGFLLSARAADGWWKDFDSTRGASDEWVTAYVGATLAGIERAPAAEAARGAWCLLRHRRWWSGGWGYNPWVPADADSTQWALRLAAAVGDRNSIRVRRARRFLASHVRASGGLATYEASGPGLFFFLSVRNVYDAVRGLTSPGGAGCFRAGVRGYLRRKRPASFRGWSAAHGCVTAAAAGLAEINADRSVRAFLRRSQAPDGSWSAYWWNDCEYSTALAAEALAKQAQPEDLPHLQAAIGWAARRLGPDGAVRSVTCTDGSPFATAWCVRLLLLGADEHSGSEPLQRCLAWLLRQQRVDGSWPPSAWLRTPPPELTDPEQQQGWVFNGRGYGTVRLDQHAVFTTATVLEALGMAEARLIAQDAAGSAT